MESPVFGCIRWFTFQANARLGGLYLERNGSFRDPFQVNDQENRLKQYSSKKLWNHKSSDTSRTWKFPTTLYRTFVSGMSVLGRKRFHSQILACLNELSLNNILIRSNRTASLRLRPVGEHYLYRDTQQTTRSVILKKALPADPAASP